MHKIQKMKITFVCKHLANGGAERVISELITEFIRRGIRVQLVLLFDEIEYSKKIEFDIPDSVELVELNWKPEKRMLQALLHNGELRKVISGDCIVSMLYPATEASIIAGKKLKIPVIVSERNNPRVSPPTKKGRIMRNCMFNFADACVFQTHEAMAFFPCRIQRKGVIIPNPIRPDLPGRFLGEREKKIAVVGRLEKQKNHPMMLRTFQKFSREYEEYELHIFSRGPLLDELQAYSRELGIGDKVFFEGFVPNVNDIINSYEMYISTSDYEGISNAMLEALAMGIPSICTDCPVGGARETIKNGYNGFLIPVGDEIALLEAMKKIVTQHRVADEIGINATKVKENLSIRRIADRWLDVVNNMISTHKYYDVTISEE